MVQVPGYIAAEKDLRDAGIDDVFVYCVNDSAVMEAWGRDQKIDGSIVTFLADPTSDLTKALDVELTHPGPLAVLGPGRCKRFAMLFDKGVCKSVQISESPDDPTDGNLELSLAPNMLKEAQTLLAA
mmetsp:Transcript_26935/g.82673  ORF Transcript_26935/g.82673 Transcript_26935/m.82673 type:complete len:127 (+) Transcript_26935:317-697(+)